MDKKRKFGINSYISWGASVVIIGLMFKILYLPYGEYLIGLGLLTEACLFFILGFYAEKTPAEEKSLAPAQVPVGHTAALDQLLHNADITPEMIGRLGTGLKSFGEKVDQLSQISDASIATQEFAGKLKSASLGFDKLNSAFEKASSELAGISSEGMDAQGYHQQIQKLTQNLESLNRLYETELKQSDESLRSMTQHYHSIAETLRHFNDSAEDSKTFKEQVALLTQNLTSLNAVYGNMLQAMNQPRG